MLVFSGCCNKIPHTGQLKQQKLIFSPFLEAGSQRSRCWQDWILLRPLSLTFRDHLTVPSGDLSYVPIRREREISGVSSSSYKDLSATGLGSLMTSLNLNYLLKSLCPNTVSLEVRVWDEHSWVHKGTGSCFGCWEWYFLKMLQSVP